MSWLEAAAWLAELRPTATIDEQRCTRRHDSGCTLCVAICPKQAITTAAWSAAVDPDACIGCGLCVVECPVTAIDGPGLKPAAVLDRVSEHEATLRCDVARLLLDDEPADDQIEWADVPCVGVVHPETLAAAAIRSGSVTVQTGPCSHCPIGAGQVVSRTIERASAITAASGSPGMIRTIEVQPRDLASGAPSSPARTSPEPTDRRDMSVADSRPNRHDEPEQPSVRRRGWLWRRSRAPQRPQVDISRRSLLGISRLAGDAREGRATAPAAATPAVTERRTGGSHRGSDPAATPRELLLAAAADPALPRVHAEPGCTGCEACVRICPADALGYARETLTFDATACLACGECVRVCPERVLGLEGSRPGAPVAVLAHVETQFCSRCDLQLGPGERDLCHRCAVRQSLVDDVWDQLG